MNTNRAKALLKKEFNKYFMTPYMSASNGLVSIGHIFDIDVRGGEDCMILKSEKGTLAIGDAFGMVGAICSKLDIACIQHTARYWANANKSPDMKASLAVMRLKMIRAGLITDTDALVYKWERDEIKDIKAKAAALRKMFAVESPGEYEH